MLNPRHFWRYTVWKFFVCMGMLGAVLKSCCELTFQVIHKNPYGWKYSGGNNGNILRVGIQGGLTDSAHPAQNVSW